MCNEHSPGEVAWSAPRLADGPAVDPLRLPEVDQVTVTTMIDNT
jgi:7,8-dihydropterin-6-yl-methyl-4-(beta-D-ribofuranosyl)aminobenzene 5'-phosphate synthase